MKMREICRMSLCTVLVLVGISSAHPPGSEKIPLVLRMAADRRSWEDTLKKKRAIPSTR